MSHLWPVDTDPQLFWTAHTHTHTDTSTEFHMVFVHVSWRGNMLFPLLRGIYCHRGQSSEFRDQEVTELHHLADRTSKYLEVFTV